MMNWFAITNARAVVFLLVFSSATIVEAQRPGAVKREKNSQDRSKEADTSRGKSVHDSVVERYLRSVISKERKTHAEELEAKKKAPTPSAVERYLRSVIGKERQAHAKEIAELKKKATTPSAVERYLRTVIGNERQAHAKEIADLKKQLRELEGNLKPNARRPRTKLSSE